MITYTPLAAPPFRECDANDFCTVSEMHGIRTVGIFICFCRGFGMVCCDCVGGGTDKDFGTDLGHAIGAKFGLVDGELDIEVEDRRRLDAVDSGDTSDGGKWTRVSSEVAEK
jgi:hypothetical protein